jgi:Family of unknown function (DUF5681)
MPNPENLTAPRFKPGQSGNPGGLSKELRAQITANAEKATRLRAALLDQEIAKLEAGEKLVNDTHTRELCKQAEDRGLGAPSQHVEANGGLVIQLTKEDELFA